MGILDLTFLNWNQWLLGQEGGWAGATFGGTEVLTSEVLQAETVGSRLLLCKFEMDWRFLYLLFLLVSFSIVCLKSIVWFILLTFSQFIVSIQLKKGKTGVTMKITILLTNSKKIFLVTKIAQQVCYRGKCRDKVQTTHTLLFAAIKQISELTIVFVRPFWRAAMAIFKCYVSPPSCLPSPCRLHFHISYANPAVTILHIKTLLNVF